ncbi:hypothetical protein [Lachnoanaerobaculum sp. OBRC5-5]|uniref:hypothetical protein n=1 Tax=Lachnoanaerobaculum sp. OBRC5-5 TaxID=936595 RepID=UPI00028254C7|nr:hypothetical protein [Lachnoanaerobaculum sp. OBRC5-5]EJZ69574.1 hypothetical protein HMPREF1135_02125 [Lachnoanaerobaculum sp. OBRC5-5]
MRIICIFCVILIMSGCRSVTHKKEVQNHDVLETSDISTDNFEHTLKSDDFDFPVPEISCKIISSTKYEISLITTDSENLEKYYKKLKEGNWQVLRPATSGSPVSMYFNGFDGLVITDSKIDDVGNREVVIDYYNGKRDNSFEYIKKYEDIIRDFFSDDVIYAISEYDISEATTKLGLRGFYVYTDKIEPAKLIIDKYNNIILVNYDQFVISDIDSDGEDELITRLGYGFGRYIITLSAFKYNPKEMVMLCKTQYEQMGSLDMFIRENNGNVEVIAGEQKNGEIDVLESYGNLEINNGVLRPKKKDIPFKILEEN